MDFEYERGQKTVEQALQQGIRWVLPALMADETQQAVAEEVAADVLDEIQVILTGELTKLLDVEGVADQWNDAIENAIRTIEGCFE